MKSKNRWVLPNETFISSHYSEKVSDYFYHFANYFTLHFGNEIQTYSQVEKINRNKNRRLLWPWPSIFIVLVHQNSLILLYNVTTKVITDIFHHKHFYFIHLCTTLCQTNYDDNVSTKTFTIIQKKTFPFCSFFVLTTSIYSAS